MGGLLAKLQVTSSGDRLWAVAANRPLDSLVTTEKTRSFLREIFYFEPMPMIRRVIFIATPHDGSPVAGSLVGRFATSVVQRPSDTVEAVAQINRDNPGALGPLLLQRRLPSSIDVLARGQSALARDAPAPLQPLGHPPHHRRPRPPPARVGRGDHVVPLPSAHLDEAVSELWVPAIHTNIYYHPQTIAEVQRILAEHAARGRGQPSPRVASRMVVRGGKSARLREVGRSFSPGLRVELSPRITLHDPASDGARSPGTRSGHASGDGTRRPVESVPMESEQSIIPTLQILSGPRAGRLYKIDRDLMVIGRNTDCDLVLEPKSVSRRHAAIVRRKHDHVIKDLGSTRGTYVNGLRLAQPVVLKSGCVIQLGEVQLTFKTQVVEIHEDSDEQSTVYAAIDMATPSDRIESAVKPEEKLRALQKIIQTFGTTLVLSEILEDVLSTLFDIFPHAERGFVLLEDRKRKILAPEAIRTRSGPAGELSISKSVLQRALKNGQAILGKDVPLEFPQSQSVTEVRIRSLMCVPILDQERRPIGILQIDTRDGRGRFDQDDLDLLVSVAYQISVAVQNARLHGDLIKQHELEQELVFARQVMQAMLPERPRSVPGYDFWDCYEPARHVGGDYYGFLPLYDAREDRHQPARRWAIAVGDVVGKGLPAALLTARLSAEIRLFLQSETDPAQVVSLLNQQLIENGVLDMFITFLLVVLDIPDQRIRVANAGHPCPLSAAATAPWRSSASRAPDCPWRSSATGSTRSRRRPSSRATSSCCTPTGCPTP